MTEFQFDELSKALAKTTSRRGAIKLFGTAAVGGVLSLFTARSANARLCRDIGQNCSSNAECCSRFCETGPYKCACPTGTEVCQNTCVPTCQGATVLDPTTCQCVCPPDTSPCGGGLCCGPGQVCQNGQCVMACPQGTIQCGFSCCDAQTQICQNGVCVSACPQGTSPCGPPGVCCDNQTQVCQNGVCLEMCPGIGFCPAGSTCCTGFGIFTGTSTCCFAPTMCTHDFLGNPICA